eukprot:1261940-Rhodomonas_salina.1
MPDPDIARDPTSLSCPSSPETVPKDGRNRSQSVPAVRDGDEDRKDRLQRNMSTRSIGRKNMFSGRSWLPLWRGRCGVVAE